MIFCLFFSIFTIIKIILSEPTCLAGFDYCSRCNPITKLCVKCEKDIYTPDANGGCENAKKCEIGKNYCFECLEDGKICKQCDIGYFPDENGACSITDNCEISYKGECLICKNNYVLIGIIDFEETINNHIKICKPKDSDDLLHCRSISYERGFCLGCEEGYYLTSSDKKCTNIQNCAQSLFGVCKKCDYGYYLDKKQQKCLSQSGSFINCKISNDDGTKCRECNEDFYFDEEGKCVYSNYCSKGQTLQCDKCIDGYYLTSLGGVCTTEQNCYSGDKDFGVCTQCNDNYCIDFHDGKCKSNLENNDLKYCKVADVKCKECIIDAYLGQDQKCSNSTNCAESENGECIKCIDNYYLGLDKKCTNVENCIYSDNFFNCIECKGNYYYNLREKKCKLAEGNLENCKSGYDSNCERCKEGFYINKTDNICYSNNEQNDFYKCEISNGYFCTKCIEKYYLGFIDYKCSKVEYCGKIENENRCLICQESYCLDAKTGLCEDNELINDIEKIFYYRCNRTNADSTACELCLEGYELRDGLCFDEQHCVERNSDGTCKRCKRTPNEYFEQCLNNIFGCIEGYSDRNCLECNDLNELGYCTLCMEGYELDKYNFCVEIDEI